MNKIKRGAGTFIYFAEDVHGDEHELTVRFSGYSDPGRTYGPPDMCYPPEGEMEIDCKLPDGVDFGDIEKLHEQIEEMAYEKLEEYDPREERE